MQNLNLNPGSLAKLNECALDLQRLFKEVSKTHQFLVICGHRGEEAQNKAFSEGKSKQKWPGSKHNSYPSDAIDIAPIPLDYSDPAPFYAIGGFIMGVASQMGIRVKWGADWNQNGKVTDEKFLDLGHFELLRDTDS